MSERTCVVRDIPGPEWARTSIVTSEDTVFLAPGQSLPISKTSLTEMQSMQRNASLSILMSERIVDAMHRTAAGLAEVLGVLPKFHHQFYRFDMIGRRFCKGY
jgi:hypothetical protein